MRAQMKTPARFEGRALGLPEHTQNMERLPMNVRNRAPVRNHIDLPLWRFLITEECDHLPSYAVRKLTQECPGFSQHQAALYAELIGYPLEEG